jgi:phospholipid N-methyltransferase
MMERDRSQREEILEGLQHRINAERAILQLRLTRPEPMKKKRATRSRKPANTRRTGRLYEAFQALGEDE